MTDIFPQIVLQQQIHAMRTEINAMQAQLQSIERSLRTHLQMIETLKTMIMTIVDTQNRPSRHALEEFWGSMKVLAALGDEGFDNDAS